MRYIIIPPDRKVFTTEWFIVENNFIEGMIVIDKMKDSYTLNGLDWIEVEEDHL